MIIKKTLCGLAILFLLVQPSLAQTGTLTEGPMIKQTMQMSWADLDPIGSDATGVYYVLIPYSAIMSGMVIGDSDFYIGKVGLDGLEMSEPVPMDFSLNDDKVSYEFALSLKGKMYVFTSYEDKENRKWQLFAQQVNSSDLTLSQRKKVGEIDFADERFKSASFSYDVSEDESRLLITYSLLDKNSTLVSFGYDVFDNQLTLQSQWNGNLDMTEGIYLFDQFRVNAKGEVYLLTRFFKDKKEYKHNADLKKNWFLSSSRSMEIEANYETRIVKFGKGNTTKIMPVAVDGKFLCTADISFQNQKFYLNGFYSAVGSTLPEGAVFLQLDPVTGKVLKSSKKAIGDMFALPSETDSKSGGLASDDQYANYRFLLKEIINRADGSFTYIGERLVTQTKTQRSGNTVTTYVVYQTDDLAVVDVSAGGDIQNVNKVEKSQQTLEMGYYYASYFATERNGKLLIFFTNLGKNSANMLGAFKDTSATLVTIDKSGNQERQEIFNSENQETTLRAQDTFETTNGAIIMNSNKNNRYCRFLKWQ